MLHVLAEHCRGAALVPVPIRHFIRGMAVQGILRAFLDVGLLTRCLGFIGFIGLINLQGLGLARAYRASYRLRIAWVWPYMGSEE